MKRLRRLANRSVADASVNMANCIGDLLDLHASKATDPTRADTFREAADIARVAAIAVATEVAG